MSQFRDLLSEYISSCDSFPYNQLMTGSETAQAITINNWLLGEMPEPKIEEHITKILKDKLGYQT